MLQLKLCFYTIVRFLSEEFESSLKSSLRTQSLCHTVSPRVGVGVQVFKGGKQIRVWES